MRYKEIVKGNFSKMRNDESLMWASIDLVDEMLEEIKEHHPDMYWAFLRDTHELMCGKHYNEAYAKWQVDNMWHVAEDGREHKGERWSMKDAANAMTKYRGRFPNDYNEYDFYVAINAQWHDTICVAKRHFSTEEEAETYILDEAVAVWLNDSDWPANDKVWSYFRCKS